MIAESYERIHRSNLLGMGIVPLQYLPGQTAESLGLTGKETYTISMPDNLTTGQILDVQVCMCVCVCVCVCVWDGVGGGVGEYGRVTGPDGQENWNHQYAWESRYKSDSGRTGVFVVCVGGWGCGGVAHMCLFAHDV